MWRLCIICKARFGCTEMGTGVKRVCWTKDCDTHCPRMEGGTAGVCEPCLEQGERINGNQKKS